MRQRWIKACVIGELLGFAPPAITGALLFVLDAPEVLLVTGLVLAGVVEGIILGSVQARVIAEVMPTVSGWTRATATAAGLAWLAGMGGSSLVQAAGPAVLIGVLPAWICGLLSMGFLQARRLKAAVKNSNRWVPITSAAWFIGVMVPVVVLSIIPNEWPLVVHVIAAVVAAVGMGAAVGVISAGTLVRFADEHTRI